MPLAICSLHSMSAPASSSLRPISNCPVHRARLNGVSQLPSAKSMFRVWPFKERALSVVNKTNVMLIFHIGNKIR